MQVVIAIAAVSISLSLFLRADVGLPDYQRMEPGPRKWFP